MSFSTNGIRNISGLKSTEENRSYNYESNNGQEDGNAIMLLLAAIAAGVVEIVEDGIVSTFKKN